MVFNFVETQRDQRPRRRVLILTLRTLFFAMSAAAAFEIVAFARDYIRALNG